MHNHSSTTQPLDLTPRGRRRLITLRDAVPGTALETVERLFRLIDAHPDLPGLIEVVARLNLVLPWIDRLRFATDPRFDGLSALVAALQRPDSTARWHPESAQDARPLASVTNLIGGAITRYPHYAIYTEQPGDRDGRQGPRVAPLIAFYTLLANTDPLPTSLAKGAASALRKLLDPAQREAFALAQRCPSVASTPAAALEVVTAARQLRPELDQLFKRLEVSAPPPSRPPSPPPAPPAPRVPKGVLGGPDEITTVIRPPPVNPTGGEPDEPDEPEQVLPVPPGAGIDPEILRRPWSLATEMANQFLDWQWPTLNAHEIAVLANELKSLLAADDPLGVLIGLSLATARPAADVLAIELNSLGGIASRSGTDRYCLDLQAGTLDYPSAAPEDSYRPTPEARAVLQEVSDRVCLRVPPALLQACRGACSAIAPGSAVGEVLGLTSEAATALVEAWCTTVRTRDPRLRLTAARIARWPIARMLHHTRDVAPVAHAFQLVLPGCCLSHYSPGGFSNYLAAKCGRFPTLITPVEQCWEME